VKRINVIGTSGSGKSTFSRKLASKLNYPYIEMDALYWKPNWTESEGAEFFALLKESLSHPVWVLDGNYNETAALKWAQADTIIWIDYSFIRTLLQVIKRAMARSISRQEVWPGTGNVETFRKSFCSSDSVILWMVKTYAMNRRRYECLYHSSEYAHIHFVRIKNPKMADNYLYQASL
jgi:adenylate kinase family enzyme